MAREFGSKVQKLRKSTGLREQDVIEVFFNTTDKKLEATLNAQAEGLYKTLKVPTLAHLDKMPANAVTIGKEESDNLTIVITRVAAVVDVNALVKQYGKVIGDAVESFVASMDYAVISEYLLEHKGISIGLKDINYPTEVWPDSTRCDVPLQLGKTIFLSTRDRLAASK